MFTLPLVKCICIVNPCFLVVILHSVARRVGCRGWVLWFVWFVVFAPFLVTWEACPSPLFMDCYGRCFGLYTLFINGCQFKVLLYVFKLAQLTSFESNNSFELTTQKRG